MTIQQWLEQTTLRQTKATELLFHLLNPKTTLDGVSFVSAHQHDELSSSHITTLNRWQNRLHQGEPLQYILGYTIFRDLKLKVDHRTLIPRQETEELVELVIQELSTIYKLKPNTYNLTLADIGTGCGAIALSLATWATKTNKDIHIIATDLSQDALDLAAHNYLALKPNTYNLPPISFRLGSLLEPIDERLDIIVANLPYIPSQEMEKLPKSVRGFEPHLALDGGNNGLDLIHDLIKQAPKKLSPQGALFLEIWDEHQLEDFAQYKSDYTIIIQTDQFNRNRFLILTLL